MAEEKTLKQKIAEAVKRGDTQYLRGVLQVAERVKDEKQVDWLRKKIKEIQGRKQ